MLPQFTNEPALRLILPALTLLLALTGFLRGLGRLLVLAVSLAGGAAAGMAWFRYGPALCIQWFGSLPVWLVNYGSMIAAVVGAWVVHRLVTGLAGVLSKLWRSTCTGGQQLLNTTYECSFFYS